MAASMYNFAGKSDGYTEYKLRVPKNLRKTYNIMKINSPRPIKFENIKEAKMMRKTKKQVYVGEETSTMPSYGAGSVYNYERKEEARRKRRGYISREIKPDDLPYALRIGGKGGKRYTGRKEPVEHSAYYILRQCADGVFEAVPVEAWYNFIPDINYKTLTADEVENEFSKRDRTLTFFTNKYNLTGADPDDLKKEDKIKNTDSHHGLIIHDDIENEEEDYFQSDEDEPKDKKSEKQTKKDAFASKKGSDEEEEIEGMFESKEVDYMSESSSENEEIDIDDEPDPGKEDAARPKDDLNKFSDSSEDEEDEEGLNEQGKELNAILKKKEGGDDSSDGEGDDEDIDDKYSKSAIFLQGNKKKKGSNSNSKAGSRSSTPIQDSTESTLNQTAKVLKDGKSALKRPHSAQSNSPQSKKSKSAPSPLTVNEGSRSSGITEEKIRQYLSHKPMTTTDLVRKFKSKKSSLSKKQTVDAIAAILKKIDHQQEKKDGKLYLSIKTSK